MSDVLDKDQYARVYKIFEQINDALAENDAVTSRFEEEHVAHSQCPTAPMSHRKKNVLLYDCLRGIESILELPLIEEKDCKTAHELSEEFRMKIDIIKKEVEDCEYCDAEIQLEIQDVEVSSV